MHLVKDLKSVNYKIDILKALKKDFKVLNTTYTTTFLVDKKRIKYCSKKMNKSVFFAHNKIKSDLQKSNFLEFVKNNPVHAKPCTYYELKDYLEETNGIEAINIDINNAYPSVLFNFGGITGKTFDFINRKLSKPDKLAALGMLASKKTIYTFKRGILETLPEIEEKETDEIFFFCVKFIAYVIGECKKIAQGYFLFSWVDGIYLKRNTPVHLVERIKAFILDLGFGYSCDLLTNMKIKRDDKIILFSFVDPKGKKKEINVPNYHVIRRTNRLIKNKLNKK